MVDFILGLIVLGVAGAFTIGVLVVVIVIGALIKEWVTRRRVR
jgi:hypothetical protein